MKFVRETALGLMMLFALPLAGETLVITSEVIGKSPDRIGYNLAHFMPDSNAADWWRYSGVKSARAFLSATLIEPEDDLPGRGDGVTDKETFIARKVALRGNPLSQEVSGNEVPAHLRSPFINWPVLWDRYENGLTSGNNRFPISETFRKLREMDSRILVQITAYPGSFPLENEADWPGLWELWQHYYFQAYFLGGEFDVEDYSMFNEPNHRTAGGVTTENWLLRLRFASDAIQSAIADVNRDKDKNLVARVHAPTAAGTVGEAMNDWGLPAVMQRHRRFDGTESSDWRNFEVYSYQYYGINPGTLFTQATELRGKVTSLMPGEEPFSYAITEFNTRTGSSFDKVTATPDRPSHFSGLGAGAVALADAGVRDMYLFKFGMTRAQSSRSRYPVQKNGIHYVENSGKYRYGGITRSGEVWRLFNRMAAGSRDRLRIGGGNSSLALMATIDAETAYIFVSNTGKDRQPVDFDVSALSIAEGNRVTVSEVSDDCYGGIRWFTRIRSGKIAPYGATMPAESVWLVAIPLRPQVEQVDGFPGVMLRADADAALRDGGYRKTVFPDGASLPVRNGTSSPSDRQAALLGFNLSGIDLSKVETAVLTLKCFADTPGETAQAHLYGLQDDGWDESTVTFANLPGLRQKQPAGSRIANNVILGDGKQKRMLGQIVADSKIPNRYVDVTGFVKSQADGRASFLVIQEARWDTDLREKKLEEIKLRDGDIQKAGLLIGSRESAAAIVLRLVMRE